MLALNDAQLRIVMTAARSVLPDRRDRKLLVPKYFLSPDDVAQDV